MGEESEYLDSRGDPFEGVEEGSPCIEDGCKGHYVLKVRRKDGHEFLGCSAYPKCKSATNIEAYDTYEPVCDHDYD